MTVQNISRRAGPFTGTGLVSSFPFGFKVFSKEDIEVLRAVSDEADAPEEILRLDDDYSVTLNADQDENPGGTVTLSAPLAVGLRLAILSAIAPDQQVVLTNHDGFLPETLNVVHDRAIALIQELKEEADRTLKTPATSDKTPEQLTQELLSAQSDARVQADAAAKSAEAAKASEEATAEYAEAAKVLAPHTEDLQKVAADITSIVEVGSSLEDIGTVLLFKPEIITVSENIENIQIASDLENLEAYRIVAGIRDDVITVSDISADVVTVSRIGASVENVSSNAGSITTVSGSIGNVNLIAKDLEGGGSILSGFQGGPITEDIEESTEITGGVIKAVADKIADVHTVAANIDAILASPSNAARAEAAATAAASSASVASQYESGSQSAANLSRQWAVQTTAPVEGDLYGAKYYAFLAAETAVNVGDAMDALTREGVAQREAVSAVGEEAVTAVNTAKTNAVSDINNAASAKKEELETVAGMYYTPSVSDEGVLSWTNNGGKENPAPVSVKGPKGDTGLGFVIKAQYDNYDAFIAAHPTGSEGDNYQMADTGEIWSWDTEALTWKNIGKLRGSSANEVPMETDPTDYYESTFPGFGDLVTTAEE